MNVQELIGKRVLLVVNEKSYYTSHQVVEEYKVLEVSLSGSWVKLMNSNGRKFWKAVTELSLVEVLKDLHSEKPEE